LWSGKEIWRKIREERSKLHLDNDGEYTNDIFLQLCHNEGMKRHLTVRETLQQNGVAEKMNKILLEKIRCMLSNAGLSIFFWTEALVMLVISLTGCFRL